MALRIIRTLFFFSTVQAIYTVLYYNILFYTILYYTTYIYIYIYRCKYTIYYQYSIYIYSICTPPQYLTQVNIETIREYLEARSNKSVSSNSLCDLASFILKNNYFENEELN